MASVPNSTTAILLGCVKTKLDHRAKARDLYCSPLWRRRRTYAEGSGLPWLILSAKHGLVEPTRVLRPYDMALGDLRAGQRRAWGGRVVDSLQRQFGSLEGASFEVHAGAAYRDAIKAPLAQRDARLIVPLGGLSLGGQLRWYSSQADSVRRQLATQGEVRRALRDLDGAPMRIAARDWPGSLHGLDEVGLYSWWVDAAGARDLSLGLGHRLRSGRIYAGQTGATKWPSGKTGRATLGSRIGGNHLRGRIRGSTFRLTLASALTAPLGLVSQSRNLNRISEQRLSDWMRAHLLVAVHPFSDRDALGDLEDRVLAKLDPPRIWTACGPPRCERRCRGRGRRCSTPASRRSRRVVRITHQHSCSQSVRADR